MKICQLFESEIGPITPHNVDEAYKVGNVLIDNCEGLGAAGNNANVMYRGFVAFIKPSLFRRLATAGDREETAGQLLQLMKAGQSIGNPCFYIAVDDDFTSFTVYGHEGRARMLAIAALNGDEPFPVQFFPQYIRARHLKPEFLSNVKSMRITTESGSPIMLTATKVFCAGTEY